MSGRRTYSQLDSQLARLPFSYTKQRNDVFETLKYLQPCSLQDIVRALDRKVARTAVMRAIQIFLSTGLAFRPEGKLIYLSPRLINHIHTLTCTECGLQVPYRDKRIEAAIDALARSRGFQTSAHTLTILGTCGQHA
jgi:Fe2+ or Zn2+ uptake regulation protein